MGRTGIFCVEGGWSNRLTDNDSVLPLLTFIRGNGEVPFIHRYVETVDALELLLGKWSQKQYARYSLGYLGFHGSPGVLHLSRQKVTIDQLARCWAPGPRASFSTWGPAESSTWITRSSPTSYVERSSAGSSGTGLTSTGSSPRRSISCSSTP